MALAIGIGVGFLFGILLILIDNRQYIKAQIINRKRRKK